MFTGRGKFALMILFDADSSRLCLNCDTCSLHQNNCVDRTGSWQWLSAQMKLYSVTRSERVNTCHLFSVRLVWWGLIRGGTHEKWCQQKIMGFTRHLWSERNCELVECEVIVLYCIMSSLEHGMRKSLWRVDINFLALNLKKYSRVIILQCVQREQSSINKECWCDLMFSCNDLSWGK